ncbi:MAG: sensor domain-containing diguanylate cyclase [Armatimonadota bacterium]
MGSTSETGAYSWLLDELHDGAYCVDRERRISYWNPAAERLTGFTRSEVEGKCCADNILKHVDDEGNHLCRGVCPLAKTMADGQSREARVYLHHKDGHRVPVDVRCSPLRNAEGQIIGGIEIFSDASLIEFLQQRVAELRALSFLDRLTELANRRYAEITLTQCLSEFERYRWQFGMLLLDVDRFKAVCDEQSPGCCDRLLRAIAQTLRHNCRPFDLVARWGGDEFLVILKHVDDMQVTTVAKRFRALVARTFIELEDGETLAATVSVGATSVRGDDTVSVVLDRLEENVYACKRRGGNLVTYGSV